MNFSLIHALGQIGQKGSGLGARASSMPVVKPGGAARMRHFELADYDIVEVEADVDLTWRPGPAKARLRLRENLLRHFKLELVERTLRLSALCQVDGERPSVHISGPQLREIHVGAGCRADVHDVRSDILIASAFERAELRIQGHAKELHVECRQRACVDCASLICDIAIAELSGESIALLRAESALQAETKDACHLLTIGSPRILDVQRHAASFALPPFGTRRGSPDPLGPL